ncbi:peptidase propeptide and ypeb domain-containing protein [Streptococcus pneumoniae]|nr:peptidase propeptide and ypeb domain-containing protein [Streptococcus pneumoniae]
MTILFVVISASFLYMVSLSMKPYQTAKSEGEKLAQQYAGLEQADQVDQVDLYNGLESYYSVLGRNKQQEALAVLIGKDDHKIYVYQLNQGVSQEKAETVSKEKGAGEIDKITFGRYQDKPIWEVKSGSDFYLVDFETGALVNKEGL